MNVEMLCFAEKLKERWQCRTVISSGRNNGMKMVFRTYADNDISVRQLDAGIQNKYK